MQAIKCELCGSNQLTKKDGYYQCEHCGTKYTLEEAKKLIVSGTVEVVTGNAEKERLLKNANVFLQLHEYTKAMETYQKIQNQYPDDYRGWWECYKSLFYDIKYYQPCNDFRNKLINKAKLLNNLDKEYLIFWNNIKNKYISELKNSSDYVLSRNIILGNCYENDIEKEIKNYATDIFWEHIYNGDINIHSNSSTGYCLIENILLTTDFYCNELSRKNFSIGKDNAKKLFRFNRQIKNSLVSLEEKEEYIIDKKSGLELDFKLCFGKTIIYTITGYDIYNIRTLHLKQPLFYQ